MTIDELFALRELMQDVLNEKLKAKKVELERRLQELNQPSSDVGPRSLVVLNCQIRRAPRYRRAEHQLLDGSALGRDGAVQPPLIVPSVQVPEFRPFDCEDPSRSAEDYAPVLAQTVPC
jgi:hypothetical protein